MQEKWDQLVSLGAREPGTQMDALPEDSMRLLDVGPEKPGQRNKDSDTSSTCTTTLVPVPNSDELCTVIETTVKDSVEFSLAFCHDALEKRLDVLSWLSSYELSEPTYER